MSLRRADGPPSVNDKPTECDRPRNNWTELPRDVLFEAFNGAVCLEIWKTVSTES